MQVKQRKQSLTKWIQLNLLHGGVQNVKNNQNWRDYMNKLEGKTEGELQLYQVYNAINKYADQDAIYSIDVGDTTQTSTRHLHNDT